MFLRQIVAMSKDLKIGRGKKESTCSMLKGSHLVSKGDPEVMSLIR